MRPNTSGNVFEDRETSMRLYDAAPRVVRLIACHMVEQPTMASLIRAFSVYRSALRDDVKAGAAMVRQIGHLERQRTLDTYGPDHPEARLPMARRA